MHFQSVRQSTLTNPNVNQSISQLFKRYKELLNGAKETLDRNNPVINIEMKYDKRPDIAHKSARILKDLGYRFVKRTKSDEIWIKS